MLKINKFLSNFPNYTIQYFVDNKNSKQGIAKTSSTFNPTEAEMMQKNGCGVFFSINGFSNGKRIKDNLKNINGVFIDLDLAKEGDVMPEKEMKSLKAEIFENIGSSPLSPHFVIETKNGFHLIWLTSDIKNEDRFLFIIKGLAKYFGADEAGLSITKVLRLPGFLHLKTPSQPFKCDIVIDNSALPKYSAEKIIQKFNIVSPETETQIKKSVNKNELIKNDIPVNASSPSREIREALMLSIEDVLINTGKTAGIEISFKRNSDGSAQIIENERLTSGFVSSRGNFVHSSSGKNREGNQITIAEYYLNEVGGNNYNRQQIAELLISTTAKIPENNLTETCANAPLPIITFNDFAVLDIPKINFLIKDLLPAKGISMLQGHPGTFKTWLALYFAYCIINDKKVFGIYDVEPTNVLIVEIDDYIGLLRIRLEKIGFKKDLNSPRVYLWNKDEFSIIGDEEQPLIRDLIDFIKTKDIGLIIFDTFRDIHHLDENDSKEIGKILKILKMIATHCSIILLHHLGKEAKSPVISSRGSTAIPGSLISLLNLAWKESDKSLKITQTKNKTGPLIEPFLIKLQTEQCGENLFQIVESTEKPNIDNIKNLIKESYDQNPEPQLTKNKFIAQFSKENGFSKNSVKLAFDDLENEGFVGWDGESRPHNKKFYAFKELPKDRPP